MGQSREEGGYEVFVIRTPLQYSKDTLFYNTGGTHFRKKLVMSLTSKFCGSKFRGDHG